MRDRATTAIRVRTSGHAIRAALLASAALLLVAGAGGLSPAHGQNATTQTITLNIRSQNLGAALTSFADRSGLRLLFPSRLVDGKASPALSGSFTREQALARLLEGSGLSYAFTDAVTVTITDPAASEGAPLSSDGSLVLDTIDVSGAGDRNAASGTGYQGTPDWVYETAASVGVVSGEAIRSSGARNVRDAISSAPGVYSGEGQGSFPTVSPNIRGVGDSGRVVVSIDGARQNAQDGGRYGGGTGGFGTAFVDSAFIRQADITKTPDAAAGNAGSLGGGVNFRTVNADDIIAPGREWGAELDATTGSNAHDFQGSMIAATRLGDHLSLTAGLSRSQMGDYERGENGEITTSTTYDLTNRETWSSLLKLEGDFGDVKTSLSWMHQQNDFSYSPTGTSVGSDFAGMNDSVSANVVWNPESPLINAEATLWLNRSDIEEIRQERIASGILIDPETYQERKLLSFGGTIQNTSEFSTGAGPFSLNYGIEAFRDDASSDVMNVDIAEDPLIATGWLPYNRPGKRDVISSFVNGTLEPVDWMTLSGGLRYDWYRLHGTARYYQKRVTSTKSPDRTAQAVSTWEEWAKVNSVTLYNTRKTICDTGINPSSGAAVSNSTQANVCALLLQTGEPIDGIWRAAGTVVAGTTTYVTDYPEYETEVDRTDGAWLPSASVAFKPVDWLQPYVSYSHSFRPPTINEAFFSGSAVPTNSIGTSAAPNLDLRGEKARTWEAGVNIMRDDLFLGGDTLRIKASAFHRTIEDYIVMGYIRTSEVTGQQYTSFVNAAEDTTMQGVELEGNYDAGTYWVGAAATWLETDWPETTQIFSNDGGTTSGEIFAFAGAVPPRFKVSLDAGVRLFDRKVAIGARVNHVTPNLARYLDENGNLTETSDPYTTLDLHAAFNLGDHATLNLAFNNVTDQNYVPATASYIAPGRTFLMGLNVKF